MWLVLTVVAVIAAFVAGAFEGPTVQGWLKSWSASRALSAAQKVVANAEATAAALEAARKTIAAAPKTAATGPTGATGA